MIYLIRITYVVCNSGMQSNSTDVKRANTALPEYNTTM